MRLVVHIFPFLGSHHGHNHQVGSLILLLLTYVVNPNTAADAIIVVIEAMLISLSW